LNVWKLLFLNAVKDLASTAITSQIILYRYTQTPRDTNDSIGLLQVPGSNPMLAYITGGHFVATVFYLTHVINPIHKLARHVVWGTLWGVTMTLIILFTVAIFTRKKIYLRV
jgi:hypothetical protein